MYAFSLKLHTTNYIVCNLKFCCKIEDCDFLFVNKTKHGKQAGISGLVQYKIK